MERRLKVTNKNRTIVEKYNFDRGTQLNNYDVKKRALLELKNAEERAKFNVYEKESYHRDDRTQTDNNPKC